MLKQAKGLARQPPLEAQGLQGAVERRGEEAVPEGIIRTSNNNNNNNNNDKKNTNKNNNKNNNKKKKNVFNIIHYNITNTSILQ